MTENAPRGVAEHPRHPRPEHLLEPARRWNPARLTGLWDYRELLWVLAARDVKVRYTQTVLGVGWALLQPFLTMVVFSVLFGRLAQMPSDGFPYPVFLFTALLPWTLFSASVSNAAQSLVSSAALVGKVYFPRLIVPLASVGPAVVDFVISTAILVALMIVFDVPFGAGLVLAPVLALAILFAALGFGILLSALNVAYRDFRYVIPFFLQLWMFVTPVIYPSAIVPQQWKWLLDLNPIGALIEGFRAACLGRPLDVGAIAISFAACVAVFLIGAAYFERVERRFADII